jgi:hypothetical protein
LLIACADEEVASQLAIILPTRRWTSRFAEYSGSPIAGDFNHARKSSRSASFSIVMGSLSSTIQGVIGSSSHPFPRQASVSATQSLLGLFFGRRSSGLSFQTERAMSRPKKPNCAYLWSAL